MAESQPYDYGKIDPSKVSAQVAAASTAANILKYGYRVLPESYGESVAVIDIGPFFLAGVLEGIGTKNRVADIVDQNLDESHYGAIVQCDMATRVNDFITCGGRPLWYLDFIAAGEDNWFENKKKMAAYNLGTKAVCDSLSIAWVGGESQVLKDVIMPGRAVLAGALIGEINPKSRRVTGENVEAGDVIVMVEASGIHANGLSGLHMLAQKLPEKYATSVPGGTTFGEELLTPTHLYSNLVQSMLDEEVDVHRMENITGHGWRKLARVKQPYTYRIDTLPPSMPLYEFIMEQTGADLKEMLEKYNFGGGYAIYVPELEVDKVVNLAARNSLNAWAAGRVEEGPKQVVIEPEGIILDSLDIR